MDVLRPIKSDLENDLFDLVMTLNAVLSGILFFSFSGTVPEKKYVTL